MPLFHYTDLAAVVSILTYKKLWLTDLRYLNDRAEFNYGFEHLRDALKIAPYGLYHNEAYVDVAKRTVSQMFEDRNSWGLSENPLFVCSLSESVDVLSQWRGYGSYAIEFDEEALLNEVNSVVKCVYSPSRQKELALDALTNAISKITNSADPSGLDEEGYASFESLWRLAASFKDAGFTEEAEHRIIIGGVEDKKIQYRVKGNLLIPYVELDISLDCIKAIYLGPMPNQDLAYESMKGFCSKIEKKWQFETSNIEYWLQVHTSKIPYRSL